jgi:alpha/beta superfamily hydrolase
LIAYGQNDELVPEQSILDFKKKLNRQKNIEVNFEAISNANHFYKKKEKELSSTINKYIEQNIPIY